MGWIGGKSCDIPGSCPGGVHVHVQGVYLYIKLPHATDTGDRVLPYGSARLLTSPLEVSSQAGLDKYLTMQSPSQDRAIVDTKSTLAKHAQVVKNILPWMFHSIKLFNQYFNQLCRKTLMGVFHQHGTQRNLDGIKTSLTGH